MIAPIADPTIAEMRQCAPESRDVAVPALAADARAERTAWLDLFGPLPSAYMGAIEPMTLLREARACYVERHFMATILAAAAHVEHTLAEELELRNLVASDGSLSFDRAIAIAHVNNVFAHPDVRAKIDALRLVRNPLTHRKPDGHAYAIATRFRAQKRPPWVILQEDAMLALEVMHGLFFGTLRPFDEGSA
ncbi:hypothetical protein [Variovorax saccharolyticus]|uniref:hypothetical protein n=1 Tax=Variovorax saccharolyticus TaxID=3053516 RepID=UPI002577A1C1|nr:hypothetical protein [Variovorax sp. J22R187]MDM0022188.1 hypothetical protein [Variovorax sp. J22R187]